MFSHFSLTHECDAKWKPLKCNSHVMNVNTFDPVDMLHSVKALDLVGVYDIHISDIRHWIIYDISQSIRSVDMSYLISVNTLEKSHQMFVTKEIGI